MNIPRRTALGWMLATLGMVVASPETVLDAFAGQQSLPKTLPPTIDARVTDIPPKMKELGFDFDAQKQFLYFLSDNFLGMDADINILPENIFGYRDWDSKKAVLNELKAAYEEHKSRGAGKEQARPYFTAVTIEKTIGMDYRITLKTSQEFVYTLQLQTRHFCFERWENDGWFNLLSVVLDNRVIFTNDPIMDLGEIDWKKMEGIIPGYVGAYIKDRASVQWWRKQRVISPSLKIESNYDYISELRSIKNQRIEIVQYPYSDSDTIYKEPHPVIFSDGEFNIRDYTLPFLTQFGDGFLRARGGLYNQPNDITDPRIRRFGLENGKLVVVWGYQHENSDGDYWFQVPGTQEKVQYAFVRVDPHATVVDIQQHKPVIWAYVGDTILKDNTFAGIVGQLKELQVMSGTSAR
ncbi:hypothetical protein HZB01_01065 [Candidatus Woesearchaeota archaeon]|nr:hypothetical protein [Candidatus Woesearchaeota archaeon]